MSRAAVAVAPGTEVERLWLDDRSWVDVGHGWVEGADDLYTSLHERVAFAPTRVYRYDHWVDEPRLGAWFTPSTAPHPVLVDVQRGLQHRYRVRFDGAALALYRDGSDLVAFHRDRDLRHLEDTVIALLVLGEPRPFRLRPKANRHAHEDPLDGAVHELRPGHGDLVVMGGACQAGWEHSVPAVPGHRDGRISVQWRWTSHTGRPERGASYRAPRHYGR